MLLRIGFFKRELMLMDLRRDSPQGRNVHSQEISLREGWGRMITIGAGEKHDVKISSVYLNPAHAPITLRVNTSGDFSVTNPFRHPMVFDPDGQKVEIRPTMTKTLGKAHLGAVFRLLIGDKVDGFHPLELQVRVDDKPALK